MFYDLDRNQYGTDCREEAREEILRKLILRGKDSDGELAEIFGSSVERIRQLRKELTSSKTA